MRRLRIGILDLVTKSPNPSLYGRVMNANLASIMPQVVGVWCEHEGHEVKFVCYTGMEDLLEELPADLDLVFIGAFTQSAQLAYALSNFFRKRGAVTVLGGPHARCYPEDARKYYDYVLGFTDRNTIAEVCRECVPHRPYGRHISAATQPTEMPTLQERWRFVEPTLAKAPTIKIIPMIGSLGCPYTCSFCIDSTVDYQPLSFAQLRDDLKFLLTKIKNPIVGWHDPNFGVRFDDYMEAIEAAVPQGSMRHIAESSLSLLSEKHLQRLRQNGFQAILPGIESWYDLGNKSKTRQKGMDKVKQVSEHVNMILRYIPYIQTNFVMGLDGDAGPEPFELTKKFIDLSPGAFPAYSLLSAFGRAAPMNLDYQRAGRVLPFPFHFLNNNHAMNVRPKNYTWPEFYKGLVDVTRYSFSWKAIARRIPATPMMIPKWMNVVRAVSSEGFGRIRYHETIQGLLETDRSVRSFMEGETDTLPEFYAERIRRELGPAYDFLPEGALKHDPNAYLHATTEPAMVKAVQMGSAVH
ncbi:MAG TPA: radical SAM protein [Gemmatimonadales bacterium]|nr:radical SAM protein [Gemmatimonadales bacterium]